MNCGNQKGGAWEKQNLQASLFQIKKSDKMRKSIKLLMFVAITAIAVSCGEKKQTKKASNIPENPRMDMTMARSGEDTLQIIKMTKEYLDNLVNNDIDKALASLYEIKDNKAHPLSEKRLSEIRKTLETFPVIRYNIDEVFLYSDSDTEVRYTYEFFEKGKNKELPNTVKASVHPRRIESTWYLTIVPEKTERN